MNLNILLSFPISKANTVSYSVVYFFSLLLLSSLTLLKAGNRVLEDLKGKRFLSAGGSRKLSKGQLFYVPFYSLFQFYFGGRKKKMKSYIDPSN